MQAELWHFPLTARAKGSRAKHLGRVEIGVGQGGAGNRRCSPSGRDPALNGAAVVGEAVGAGDGVRHDLWRADGVIAM